MEGTRVIIASDIHYCGDHYGMKPDERLDSFAVNLENEYNNDPYAALLLLGDYSLDHWAWNTKGCYINKPILYTGNYSYSGEGNTIRCLPGYRELLITDSGISSKYIVPSGTYRVSSVRFITERAEQDVFEMEF